MPGNFPTFNIGKFFKKETFLLIIVNRRYLRNTYYKYMN